MVTNSSSDASKRDPWELNLNDRRELTDDDFHHCSEPGCEAKIRNHRWGNPGNTWFLTKDHSEGWCPDHLPTWVIDWRAQQAAKKNPAPQE